LILYVLEFVMGHIDGSKLYFQANYIQIHKEKLANKNAGRREMLLSALSSKKTQYAYKVITMWHVVLLLGNDREISNYTTTITRQRPVNSNRGTVFSVRSVPRCYKKNKLEVAVS
jgi:hypothetical protein